MSQTLLQEETLLKIFGTGQITIPKSWRDFFNSKNLKAIFQPDENQIIIKPIQMVEMEETEWVSAKNFQKDLNKANLNSQFKKDLLNAYKDSDFYKNKE